MAVERATVLGRESLERFRDLHKGKRCFIVGNGPSLTRMNLRRLEGEIFFAANRAYLAYQRGLPRIPYYCLSDIHVFNRHRAEIVGADVGDRFYRETAVPEEVEGIRVPYLDQTFMYEGAFLGDVTQGTARGHTVVLDLCVPLAFYMGIEKVYLIGCDFSWKQAVHFYTCAGDAAVRAEDLPVQRMFRSFEVAREVFEASGRELVNATLGGDLTVLDRAEFETLF